jgi:anaerobic dimethyl sulfoxide reductase subunit B
MAKQYGFYVEMDKCVECHACEVACKSANQVELGVSWRRVVTLWAGQFPKVSVESVSLACMHCGDPACEAVCPTGAITKRPEDGIVVVDQTKCIGCHLCGMACPFGVPQYGKDGKMQKCELCLERMQAGLQPACVWTCPASAIHAGPLDELSKLAQQKSAKTLGGATLPSVLIAR